jgi:hypothetical protein
MSLPILFAARRLDQVRTSPGSDVSAALRMNAPAIQLVAFHGRGHCDGAVQRTFENVELGDVCECHEHGACVMIFVGVERDAMTLLLQSLARGNDFFIGYNGLEDFADEPIGIEVIEKAAEE